MESGIVHQQLNKSDNDTEARHMLVCYLDYLLAYRRDVPDVDDYVVNELQSLQSTKYVKELPEGDAIYEILRIAEGFNLDDDSQNKAIWSVLKNKVMQL